MTGAGGAGAVPRGQYRRSWRWGVGVLGCYQHKTGWGPVSVHIRSCARIASLMRLECVGVGDG